MNIHHLRARTILDSRGYPTTEVDLFLEDGSMGRASTPSGASTGSHEALELRDGDEYFDGKGVRKALNNIDSIRKEIVGKSFSSQRELDEKLIALDGTENKSNLGANAILPVSLAYAKAVAISQKKKLFEHLRDEFGWKHWNGIPKPLINVLNGGKHAPHSTDIQEWMITPSNPSASFGQGVELAARVFYALRTMMNEKGVSGVGDEGGFPLPHAKSNEEALEILTKAITRAGLVPGKDISFALDIASSELYEGGTYNLTCDNKKLTGKEFLAWQQELVKKYPIISIEDGFAEDDFDSWKEATKEMEGALQLVGDDLFVTNVKRIALGVREGMANAVLIKVNQIGTLTETADAISYAKEHGYKVIVSHRSGETEDATIAHLAVACSADQVKIGSLSRSERLAKYNELFRIEDDFMDEAARHA